MPEMTLFQRLSAYLTGGGPLMPLIGFVSVLIWLFYLAGYIRLKRFKSGQGDFCLAEAEIASMLGTLRLLVTVAPLLGLLGTVLGMTGTFRVLASGTEEMASRLADGIHIALYTTQAGLMAAIPGVFALAHLQHLMHGIRDSLLIGERGR